MTKRLVRIFVPAKSAMQSGRARSQAWAAEFARTEAGELDHLMGWPGSGDTARQVQLRFPTKEAAIAWAEAEGHAWEVEEPKPVALKPKSYSDNFRTGRSENWTH
jgi:hypothetical protein